MKLAFSWRYNIVYFTYLLITLSISCAAPSILSCESWLNLGARKNSGD